MNVGTVSESTSVSNICVPPVSEAGRRPRWHYQFSPEQYRRMGELGILGSDAHVELLEGVVVTMSPIGPAHAYTTQRIYDLVAARLPAGWTARMQSPITFERSEPQPDLAIVRGSQADFKRRHPHSAEVGLIVETSDASLDIDRAEKGPIYAAAGIPIYWIINLIQRQVEVYSNPIPATDAAPARYAHEEVFGENDTAPIVLDGQTAIQIAVRDLLP